MARPSRHGDLGWFAQPTSSADFVGVPSPFEPRLVLPSRLKRPRLAWSTAPPSVVEAAGGRPEEAGIAKGGEEPGRV